MVTDREVVAAERHLSDRIDVPAAPPARTGELSGLFQFRSGRPTELPVDCSGGTQHSTPNVAPMDRRSLLALLAVTIAALVAVGVIAGLLST